MTNSCIIFTSFGRTLSDPVRLQLLYMQEDHTILTQCYIFRHHVCATLFPDLVTILVVGLVGCQHCSFKLLKAKQWCAAPMLHTGPLLINHSMPWMSCVSSESLWANHILSCVMKSYLCSWYVFKDLTGTLQKQWWYRKIFWYCTHVFIHCEGGLNTVWNEIDLLYIIDILNLLNILYVSIGLTKLLIIKKQHFTF